MSKPTKLTNEDFGFPNSLHITRVEAREQFEKVCGMIGQPWAEGEHNAKPGDWFIMTVGHFFSIWEKTEDDKKPVAEYKNEAALNMWDFYRSMHQVEAFLNRYKKNIIKYNNDM